jgi:hypothetical protein
MHAKQLPQFKSQTGQIVVAVVLLMILALLLGVTISSRFAQSLHTLTQTDDSAKALAVAEAGIERTLLVSNETLDDYIKFNSCGANCLLTITDTNGSLIRATIALSYSGNSSEPYVIAAKKGQMDQVSLSGYGSGKNISVCWDTDASIYLNYVYKLSTNEVKSDVYAYNSVMPMGQSGFPSAVAQSGHRNCFIFAASNTPYFARIKPYYADATVYVIPASGEIIPKQGILITSLGQSGTARKTVRVLKTDPIMPELFDYTLFQKTQDSPLSNN